MKKKISQAQAGRQGATPAGQHYESDGAQPINMVDYMGQCESTGIIGTSGNGARGWKSAS